MWKFLFAELYAIRWKCKDLIIFGELNARNAERGIMYLLISKKPFV